MNFEKSQFQISLKFNSGSPCIINIRYHFGNQNAIFGNFYLTKVQKFRNFTLNTN